MSRLLPLNSFSPMALLRPMQTKTESQVCSETGRGGSKELTGGSLKPSKVAELFGSLRRADELVHSRQVRLWHFCDITGRPRHVRFSNRPLGVKRFQTIHRLSVNVARGLVLLFGIGTKALPSWDSKTRWNNLLGGLAVKQTVSPSGHANSPHPSSREGHHSTARWSSSFPPMLMPWPVPGSSGTQCRQPICGA